jgi:alanine racemase
MDDLKTRAWVEVDLGALRRNGAALAARSGVPLIPMVKADAYGLGAVEVARALLPLQPYAFGVATVREGEELRAAGIETDIIIFTPLLPVDFEAALEAKLIPTLGERDVIREWGYEGERWHLAIDTGMSRAGVRWDEVESIADLVAQSPPEGVFTHFHSAQLNDASVDVQEARFRRAITALPKPPAIVHAENSPALERRGDSHWSVARPGVFLYGVGGEEGAEIEPEQVAHVRARIVELRTLRHGETVSYDATYRAEGHRKIATVSIGYADGYRRSLSNRGVALVNGWPVPVAGLVTMDMTMVDVTGVRCQVGDVVTMLGRDGENVLKIVEVAHTAELSPYEMLVGLRLRMPRVYVDDDGERAGAR